MVSFLFLLGCCPSCKYSLVATLCKKRINASIKDFVFIKP